MFPFGRTVFPFGSVVVPGALTPAGIALIKLVANV